MIMTRVRTAAVASAALVGALAMAQPAGADAVADFYKDRTVTITIGFAPGGGADTFARFLSRHLAAHLPGKPNIIVQHMPGAGGARSVAYVYEVAPKDGTAVITPNAGVVLRVMLGMIKGAYDPAKFIWLGGWGEAVNTITLFKDNAPVKTLEEAKDTEVLLASIGKASTTYAIPALVKNTLGLKFKIISGYRGGAPIRVAIEKGEVHGWAGQWVGWKFSRPDWVRDGRLVHLLQLASKSAPDLKHVPLLSSFARNVEQRQMFDAVQTAIADRAFAAPPGVPADRVAALRTAYEKTLRDPEFLKEANARQFEIDPVSGDAIQKFVAELMATPKPLVAKMRKAMDFE